METKLNSQNLDGLVKITDPHFIVDLMYAGTEHNMTGVAVYADLGLGNQAYVHPNLWQALQRLIPYLDKTGRKLKIYDAYRPVEAHEKLFALIPQDGFFIADASRSPHCRATAVDVALVEKDGKELVYPTLVDAYDEHFAKEVQAGNLQGFFAYLKQASHNYTNPDMPEAINNRNELRKLMEDIGLVPVPRLHEWWHYELPDARSEKYPLIRLG